VYHLLTTFCSLQHECGTTVRVHVHGAVLRTELRTVSPQALVALAVAGGAARELADVSSAVALRGALALFNGRLTRALALAAELDAVARRLNVSWRAASANERAAAGGAGDAALRVDVSVSSLRTRTQCAMSLLVYDVAAYPGVLVHVRAQPLLGALDADVVQRHVAGVAEQLRARGEPHRVTALCDALRALIEQ
jgi:hypothetical protein